MSRRNNHHLASSVACLVPTRYNKTSTDPVILRWQTKKQREMKDYATVGRGSVPTKRRDFSPQDRKHPTIRDRRLSERKSIRPESKRRDSCSRNEWERRDEHHVAVSRKYQGGSGSHERLEFSPTKGRKCSLNRTMSCSRLKERSISRSPRRRTLVKPIHGILKRARSATYDGRKRVTIARFDQLVEFKSWPGEREEESGDFGDTVAGASESHKKYNIRLDEEKNNGSGKFIDKIACVKKDYKLGHFVGRNLKLKKVQHIITIDANRVSLEDIDINTDEEKSNLQNKDGNNNNDIIKVQPEAFDCIHGFVIEVERNPQNLAGMVYENLFDQLETNIIPDPLFNYLEVDFSLPSYSTPINCIQSSCPTTTLPSNLGLLPLPRAGSCWNCPQHSSCLLCTDPPSSSPTVMCTMCARLYHTHHDQDVLMLCQDKLERQLYVCKLCSDPGMFCAPQKMSVSTDGHSGEGHHGGEGVQQVCATSDLLTTKLNQGKDVQQLEPTLQEGWNREVVKSGNRWKVVFTGPDGRRFWSKSDIKKANQRGMGGCDSEMFDFRVFGSKPFQEKKPNVHPTNTTTKNVTKFSSSPAGVNRANKKVPANHPAMTSVDIVEKEPTYCMCDQEEYGEMVCCDNDICPRTWFHFNCVQLKGKPKGKWFCPKCRGDKHSVMKDFFKELENNRKKKEEEHQ